MLLRCRPTALLTVAVSAAILTGSDAAGSIKVFNLGKELDLFKYIAMISVVLMCLVIFDIVLESFEHYLHHYKGRFHQRLLNKAIKELMILGLVSFVLFILKDQAVYEDQDDAFNNTFDFVNLFLFFVGVSLVIAAVMLVLATAPLKKRWDTYANLPLPRLLDLHEEVMSRKWLWYAAWPPRYFRTLRQAQVVEYHLFRSVFLRLNRSLLTPAFDFSKYSAAIVDEFIIVFFDVGWASWLLAVVVLFITLPITNNEHGSVQVSPEGAVLFGVVILIFECLVCAYTHLAHRKVVSRMGVVGGFKGVDKILEELWVEPQHHMGQETSAIDVKDLLAAAPVKAPTLVELTKDISASGQSSHMVSQAHVNFMAGGTNSMRRTTGSSHSLKDDSDRLVSRKNSAHSVGSDKNVNGNSSTHGGQLPSASNGQQQQQQQQHSMLEATAANVATAPSFSANTFDGDFPPCAINGTECPGCESCDPLWLAPGKVQNCSVGGDPFVLTVLRPPQAAVGGAPALIKNFGVKVGSHFWFKTFFGMCTLLKCYYCAFYLSYAIGRATEDDTVDAALWAALTPIPLLLCLIPLAKRTLPIFAQLACLQGEVVWELVSDMEEQQEMAHSARAKVVSKLQGTLALKTDKYTKQVNAGDYAGGNEAPLSPRSRAIADWFSEWDRDGDGQITQDELAKGLTKLGIFLSSAELHELFRLADPDHSKSIDLDEFRHFLSDLRSLETEPERFQEKMDMRVRRCSRAEAMETRRSCQDEFGLFNDSRVGSGRGSVLSGRSPTGRQCSRAASARSMSTNGIANKKSTITEGDEMRDMEMAGDRRKSDGQERTLSPSWNKTSDTYPVRPVMDSDAASAMEALSSERKEHEEV